MCRRVFRYVPHRFVLLIPLSPLCASRPLFPPHFIALVRFSRRASRSPLCLPRSPTHTHTDIYIKCIHAYILMYIYIYVYLKFSSTSDALVPPSYSPFRFPSLTPLSHTFLPRSRVLVATGLFFVCL